MPLTPMTREDLMTMHVFAGDDAVYEAMEAYTQAMLDIVKVKGFHLEPKRQPTKGKSSVVVYDKEGIIAVVLRYRQGRMNWDQQRRSLADIYKSICWGVAFLALPDQGKAARRTMEGALVEITKLWTKGMTALYNVDPDFAVGQGQEPEKGVTASGSVEVGDGMSYIMGEVA